MNDFPRTSSSIQRLRIPLIGLALGILPLWVFMGASQSVSVDGVSVSQTRFNVLGLAMASVGLGMVVKLLWNDGPWRERWLPRTALAFVAAFACVVQLAYSAGFIDLNLNQPAGESAQVPDLAADADYTIDTVPLARGGEWRAEKRVNKPAKSSAPPDECIALRLIGRASEIGLHAQGQSLTLDIRDDHRSFIGKAVGMITLSTGTLQRQFPGTVANENVIMAKLSQTDMAALLTALEQGTDLTVTSSVTDPTTASLTGAAPVFEAFRTCTNLSQQ
ncbi:MULTISPECIES: hypothetical protein [Rhizobium]|uniref:Uncharacterized protein n=1 Tax=Rhizobium rhododendri TaxID=2506430 RepID=A0ABY8IRY9_9HYPH|nr:MULTISPECIES: hypothetical protein [Rhizobium]TQX85188.1 hypothetical protein EQW76_22445 [Rhizobium sp. rho-13.1]TQY09476.1 hypothetical protein EQW74_21650 [Rhizobium sp. rho-1.1]WFS25958.1 hypothetical protein PR018_20805 [Rhizobium rhododendri]